MPAQTRRRNPAATTIASGARDEAVEAAANVDNSVLQEQLRDQALETVTSDVVAVLPSSSQEKGRPHVKSVLNELSLSGIASKTQAAYILATADHESGFGNPRFSRSEPLVEERNNIRENSNGTWTGTDHVKGRRISGSSLEEAETNYWDSAYGGRLGNERGTTDAKNYRGRGYVQLTGEDNYRNMSNALNAEGFSYTHEGVTYGGPEGQPIDLLSNYEHVNLVPALAARVMVKGMMEGSFTGKALGSEVNESETDFYNARAVVNGDKEENGRLIQTKAWKYVNALGQWDKVIQLTKVRTQTAGAAQDTGPISALIEGPMLRRGANGERVKELQRLLNLHGADLKVDGDFGRGTQRALMRYQRKVGIEVDGVAGPEVFQSLSGGADSAAYCEVTSDSAMVETVEDLNKALGGGLAASEDFLADAKAAVTGRPILRKGAKGTRVEALQRLLSAAGFTVGVDGDFGNITYRAVLAFQLANGLSADGRVGKATAAKLHEVADTSTATAHTSGNTAAEVAIETGGDDNSTYTPGTTPITTSPDASVDARGEAAAKAARLMYTEGVQVHGSGSWETQGSNWGPMIEQLKESNNADSGSWAQGLAWCGMFVGHQYSQVGIRDEIMDKLVFWSGLRLHAFFTEGKYIGGSDEGPDQWWQPHHNVDLRGESSESKRKEMIDGFAPQAGDVVLFRQALDHVAIVSDYDANTGALSIMEGNRSNRVQATVYYPARDTSIAFFGRFNASDFEPQQGIDADLASAQDVQVTHTAASGGIR